jgi:tRNA(Ile)-lysidine synthase TilS/MesJ
MFSPQQKVVVGFSGGKDSMVLLYNVCKLQQRSSRSPQIEAILIDEGIKGYREESLQYAIKKCEEWGVPLHIITFKDSFGANLDDIIPKLPPLQINACTVCGTVRRRLLNDKARELGAHRLAIGHNLDDIAETFLQNVVRNDINKIETNPPNGNPDDESGCYVPRVKPLIGLLEEEIVRYCYYMDFPIQNVPCPYSESFPILRKKVQTFINELETNSAEIKYNLLEMNEKLYQILKKPLELNSLDKDKGLEEGTPNQKKCESCMQFCGPTRKLCYYCELKQQLF